MSLVLSTILLRDYHGGNPVEFAREAFRAVIANGRYGYERHSETGQCVYRTQDGKAACGIGVTLTEDDCDALKLIQRSGQNDWNGIGGQKIPHMLGMGGFDSKAQHFLGSMQSLHDTAARCVAGHAPNVGTLRSVLYTIQNTEHRQQLEEALDSL